MKCASCRGYSAPEEYIKGCRTIKTCLKCRVRGLQNRTKAKNGIGKSELELGKSELVPKDVVPPEPIIPIVVPIVLSPNAPNFKGFLEEILVSKIDRFGVQNGDYTLEEKVIELIHDDYTSLVEKPFYINTKKRIVQVKGREWMKLELDDPIFRELIDILLQKLKQNGVENKMNWDTFDELFLSKF